MFPFVFVSQQSDKDEVVLMQDERIHFGGFWNIIEFLKWNILGFFLINNRYIRRVFVSRVFIKIGFFSWYLFYFYRLKIGEWESLHFVCSYFFFLFLVS